MPGTRQLAGRTGVAIVPAATVRCRTRKTRPRSSWRKARVARSGIQIAGSRWTRAPYGCSCVSARPL